jgi:hypothetical protein
MRYGNSQDLLEKFDDSHVGPSLVHGLYDAAASRFSGANKTTFLSLSLSRGTTGKAKDKYVQEVES